MDEQHELPDASPLPQAPVTMPNALVAEILRCEAQSPLGDVLQEARRRSAITEARDALERFIRLQRRVVGAYQELKRF